MQGHSIIQAQLRGGKRERDRVASVVSFYSQYRHVLNSIWLQNDQTLAMLERERERERETRVNTYTARLEYCPVHHRRSSSERCFKDDGTIDKELIERHADGHFRVTTVDQILGLALRIIYSVCLISLYPLWTWHYIIASFVYIASKDVEMTFIMAELIIAKLGYLIFYVHNSVRSQIAHNYTQPFIIEFYILFMERIRVRGIRDSPCISSSSTSFNFV